MAHPVCDLCPGSEGCRELAEVISKLKEYLEQQGAPDDVWNETYGKLLVLYERCCLPAI